jgi:tetratricopeptide (TPR) repeat protein
MLCPKCSAVQKGAVARCSNCGADLLPKKSFLRSRIPALVLGVVGLMPPFVLFLGRRVPSFFASAFGPTLLGDRYRFRAEDLLESDPEQAIADFTKALELAPSYVQTGRVRIYCRRAEACARLGRTSEAIADLEQALEGWRDDLAAGRSKAYVEQMLDDLRAIQASPERIDDEGQRAAAYARRALARYRQRLANPPDAGTRATAWVQVIDDATKAVELDPSLYEGYRVRGYAYFRGGQFDEAVRDLDKAASMVSDERLAIGLRNDIERLKRGESPIPYRG